MALKNILVVYNGSESSDATLVAGVVMQNKYNAHITGLFLPGPSQLSNNLKPWMPSDVRESVHEFEQDVYSATEKRFLELTSYYGKPDLVHWIAETPDTEYTVLDYAPLYDLILIGRRDAYDERFPLSDPEQVARISSRPVLVIPKNFEQKLYTNSAVVAWDGKGPVTRALSNAVDILALRDHVTLLIVGEEIHSPKKINMQTALARHGISASVSRLSREGRHSVEDLIIAYCERHKPGLLLMGLSEEQRFPLKKSANLAANVLARVSMPVLLSS